MRQGETEKQKEESTEGGRKRRNSGALEERDTQGVLHLSGSTHESFVPLSSSSTEK